MANSGMDVGHGTSETWDFSKRETFGRLVRRTVDDAWTLIEERWPDDMPDDGELGPLADELTNEFMRHSQSVPRWAWGSQDLMRFYHETVGNFYYWFALHFLGQFVSERVQRTYRYPARTLPPAATHTRQRKAAP